MKFSVSVVLPQDEPGCLYPLTAQSLDTAMSGEAAVGIRQILKAPTAGGFAMTTLLADGQVLP